MNITKVIVITPVKNSRELVRVTIDSVKNQTVLKANKVEILHLVIDGGSTDGTLEMLRELNGIQLIERLDSGMYEAISFGLLQVKDIGSITCYLNAGDIWHENALEIVIYIMNEYKYVNWATGFKTAINNRGEIISCNKPLFYSRKMITGGFHFTFLPSIQQESTFWRSSLNLEIEHTELIKHKLAGDYFLWRSFAKSHKLYVVNAMLGAFRIHPGQLSLDRTRYRAEIRELQRRPASSYIVALLMKLLWRSQGRIAKLIASNRTFSFDLDSNKWELIRDKIVKRYNWKNISKKRN